MKDLELLTDKEADYIQTDSFRKSIQIVDRILQAKLNRETISSVTSGIDANKALEYKGMYYVKFYINQIIKKVTDEIKRANKKRED